MCGLGKGKRSATAETSIVLTRSYCLLDHSPYSARGTVSFTTQVPGSISKPTQKFVLLFLQCVAWGNGRDPPTAETSSSAVARSCFLLTHRAHTLRISLKFPKQLPQSFSKPMQKFLPLYLQCGAWGKGRDPHTAEPSSGAVFRSYFLPAHGPQTVRGTLSFTTQVPQSISKPKKKSMVLKLQCMGFGKGGERPLQNPAVLQ